MATERGSTRPAANDLMRYVLLLSALVCAGHAGQVVAAESEPTARDWLSRMGQAVSRLNYQGRFVYISNDRRESMEIVHRFDKNGERERLVSLEGQTREVLRDDDRVRSVGQGVAATQLEGIRASGLLSLTLSKSERALLEHYVVSMQEPDRVAGRDVVVLNLKPQDAYRYGYRLWVDHETGLLLRSQLLDGDGRAVEELKYTSIQVPDAIEDQMLEPAESAGLSTWVEAERTREDKVDSPWQVTWLPSGFSMHKHVMRAMPGSGRPAEQRMYSDGLASFSVYIEAVPEAGSGDFLNGLGQTGAVNAYGKRLGDHHVTVVGDVPGEAVARVASSVRYVGTAP